MLSVQFTTQLINLIVTTFLNTLLKPVFQGFADIFAGIFGVSSGA